MKRRARLRRRKQFFTAVPELTTTDNADTADTSLDWTMSTVQRDDSALSLDSLAVPSGVKPMSSLDSLAVPSGVKPMSSLDSLAVPSGVKPMSSLDSLAVPSDVKPMSSLDSLAVPSGVKPMSSLDSLAVPSDVKPMSSLDSLAVPSGVKPMSSLDSLAVPSGVKPMSSLDSLAVPSGVKPMSSLDSLAVPSDVKPMFSLDSLAVPSGVKPMSSLDSLAVPSDVKPMSSLDSLAVPSGVKPMSSLDSLAVPSGVKPMSSLDSLAVPSGVKPMSSLDSLAVPSDVKPMSSLDSLAVPSGVKPMSSLDSLAVPSGVKPMSSLDSLAVPSDIKPMSSLDSLAVPSDVKPMSTLCPVCSEVYTEPKLLPCAHRFCRKCLVAWLESSRNHPTCPICTRKMISPSEYAKIVADVARFEQGVQRQSTGPEDPEPETVQHGSCSESEPVQASQVLSNSLNQDTATASGGEPASSENSPEEETSSQVSKAVVESLPTDNVMAALADSTKKLRAPCVCSICPDQRTHAVDVCLDCGDLLCRSCTLYHSRLKATQHHQVKPISDMTAEQLARQAPEMCQTHPGQRMELYCSSHAQLVCLVCFAVGHSQCQKTETIADAAKRQRQVFQTRIQQLAETRASLEKISENIDQKQKELADSQGQVTKDISSLIDRITSAVNARKQQLMKQAEEVPKQLSTKLQQEKELADELRWLVSANHQLALDCLQNASDANFLRVGTLLERSTDKSTGAAQKIAAKKIAKVQTSIWQNAALSVDKYHVLKIEELLRDLGLVEIIEIDKDKGNEPKSFLPPATASPSAKSAVLEDFNPFLCKPNVIGKIEIKGLMCPKLMCKGHSDLLLVIDRQSVFSVCTSHPFQSEKIAALPYTVQAMAYVPDRLVMTTEKRLLLLLDVTKGPKVPVTTVQVSTVYKGVTQGLEDTLVLGPVARPCCLDILTRDGILLRTLSVGHSTISDCLCRLGDFVIASDMTRGVLHKVGLETGNREELSHKKVPRVHLYGYHLAVDHKGRLYISDAHTGLIVVDLKGQTMKCGMYCPAGFVVERDGKMFTFDPHDQLLIVYDWNKFR